MNLSLKWPDFEGKYPILLMVVIVFLGLIVAFEISPKSAEAESSLDSMGENLVLIQNNSLLPISDHSLPEPRVVKKIKVVATAYSSTPWETDDTPFVTAAGTQVRNGIVANNLLPFGTKIKIPEIYGDKIFVVEDRMHPKVGYYHIDVWFASTLEAKNFGAKRTYIEILES